MTLLDLRYKNGVKITPRLKEILHWMAMGKTNDDIGAILCISGKTVKNHVQALAIAYGVTHGNRLMTVMAALTRGDIELEVFRPDYTKCLSNGRLK